MKNTLIIKIKYTVISLAIAILTVLLCPLRVEAGNDPTKIERGTFTSPYIATIKISADVTDIEYGSFNNLQHLVAIDVAKGNENYSTYNGCLYNKDQTLLICIPQGIAKTSISPKAVRLAPCALTGHSASFRRQVKDAIAANNKGIYLGYDGKHTNPKDAYYYGGPYVSPNDSSSSVINSSTLRDYQ